MSESQNSPPPQLGTNSSSVAIAILVPFFALIFTGFGFYLYKQRCVPLTVAEANRLFHHHRCLSVNSATDDFSYVLNWIFQKEEGYETHLAGVYVVNRLNKTPSAAL